MLKQQGTQECTHRFLHGKLAVQMHWKPLFPLSFTQENGDFLPTYGKSITSLSLARHTSCILWCISCILLKTLLNLGGQSGTPHHLPFVLSGAPLCWMQDVLLERSGFLYGVWNMPSHIWLQNVFFNTSRGVNITLRGLLNEIRAGHCRSPPETRAEILVSPWPKCEIH